MNEEAAGTIDYSFFWAFLTAFIVCAVITPFLIKIIKKFSVGQEIRAEGPENHKSKSGTPTMGGIALLIGIATSLLWIKKTDNLVWIFMAMVFGNALVGFIDDFIQTAKKRSMGLRARGKLLWQVILGGILCWFLWSKSGLDTGLIFPGGFTIEEAYFNIVLAVLVMVGTVNAVNLTDGLDGLGAGTSAIALTAMTFICLKMEGFHTLGVAGAAAVGACLGFMLYNIYPARIFMGDTGSLALGGALATMAVLTRTELFLLIIGGIFVAETLSVILQVIYFKLTKGKRIFRMSPLHHHFELGGCHEALVTGRFWIVAIILAAIGMWLFNVSYRW